MHTPRRRQVLYLTFAAATILLGLASRRYREHLPAFLGEYGGDTLWALMVYLLVSTLCAGHSIVLRAALSLALAFSVELSQLYHAPWIDQIRQTTLGGLVLGAGFLWTDLFCYSIGIGIGTSAEWLWCRAARLGPHESRHSEERQNSP
jgi:hypothetical protein